MGRCSIALLFCLELSDLIANANSLPKWHYEDEPNWPGDKCQRGGTRQSPIDIHTDQIIRDYHGEFIRYGKLKFVGYDRVLVTGTNNGHTLQFSTEGDEAIHPMIKGGPLKHYYRLEQIHFHWVSEHAIDGTKYAMEIHFVHVRADLPVLTALRKGDGIAIISVLCNVESMYDEQLNKRYATDEVMQYVPYLLKTGNTVSGIIMDLKKLLGTKTESYYTYAGSLTSPECNEAVIWIIYPTPIIMSAVNYYHLTKVDITENNIRSIQEPLPVYAPARKKQKKRQQDLSSTMANTLNILTDLLNNFTKAVFFPIFKLPIIPGTE